MKLLVDIGNTSVKWALLDPAAGAGSDEPRHFGAARHGGGLPLDLLAIWDELDGVTRVTAAGVGPESVKDAVRHVCAARWASQPAWVETRAESDGVRIAYREPARLGVDRFLALIAAHRAARGTDDVGRPSLIIDAGTAITYDLLLANGTHLGGLILPGLGMMRDSLLAGTQIPPQASADAEVPWAADTAAAIAAGGLHAAGALADRLYQQLRDVDAGAGREPRLWLTGGDAERLASVIGPPVDQVPDLVLRGLAAFA